jgi:plastocyanin
MRVLSVFAGVRRSAAIPALIAATIALGTIAVLAAPAALVSQKGREFKPVEVTIKRGDVVQIVNDDGDLRHHVYIDSDKLNFDSGDQEPGTSATIAFPVAGDFDVLCAIHPKMRLVVHVK